MRPDGETPDDAVDDAVDDDDDEVLMPLLCAPPAVPFWLSIVDIPPLLLPRKMDYPRAITKAVFLLSFSLSLHWQEIAARRFKREFNPEPKGTLNRFARVYANVSDICLPFNTRDAYVCRKIIVLYQS